MCKTFEAELLFQLKAYVDSNFPRDNFKLETNEGRKASVDGGKTQR